MFKLFKGLLVGSLVALLVVDLLPAVFFMVTGIILLVSVILLFVLFHLGFRDFQGY